MPTLSRHALIGYPAGIITGVTYGLNPLFAVPLMRQGASIEAILFFRYGFAVVLLGAYLMLRRESFALNLRQAATLLMLGVLYTTSSLTLFEAYHYIASGLATTLVFLYPVIVAIIMVFQRVVPSWPVWLSIAATFAGVIIMTQGGGGQEVNPVGVLLSIGSATAYSFFIVIINRSKAIAGIPGTLITFYSLLIGAIIFMSRTLTAGTALTAGIAGTISWLNLLGLAVFPTIISTATLAVATRCIGATKASVLGVFEPITAILVGAMVFAEPLTPGIITGITISIAAITFMIHATGR